MNESNGTKEVTNVDISQHDLIYAFYITILANVKKGMQYFYETEYPKEFGYLRKHNLSLHALVNRFKSIGYTATFILIGTNGTLYITRASKSNAEIWFVIDDFYTSVLERIKNGEYKFNKSDDKYTEAFEYIQSNPHIAQNIINRFKNAGYTAAFVHTENDITLTILNDDLSAKVNMLK